MATPVGPAGTASQVVSVPPAERQPEAQRPETSRVEQTPAPESEPETRNEENPDTDSTIGSNIDTTA